MTRQSFSKLPLLLVAVSLITLNGVAYLLVPGIARASALQQATEQPATEEESQAPPEPQTIPIPEIPSRADAVLAGISEVQTLLEREPAIVEIETRLPGLVEMLDAAFADLESINLELLSVQRVRELSQVWTRHQTTLTSWQPTLEERRTALQERSAVLSRTLELWEETQRTVADEELPEGVGERMVGTLESLAEVITNLDQRLGTLLTLEIRISEQLQRTNEVLRELQAVEATARQRLLQRDSTPLWALAGEVDDETLMAQASESYVHSMTAVRQFLEAERDDFFLHVALFFLLLLALWMLKQWSQRWEVDNEVLERAKFVLSRPFSTTFLIALFAAEPIYHPMPEAIREMAMLLTLLPVVRLVPGVVKPWVRPGVYGLLILFIVAHVLGLIPVGSHLHRFVLLLVAAGGIATFSWFLRRSLWPDLSELGPGWLAARRGLQFGAFLLGVAVLANVLGWARLSDLLVAGTITSAYGAILVYAFAAVLTGIVAGLPYTPFGKKLRSLETHRDLIIRRSYSVIAFFALLLYLRGVARLFDIYQPFATAARAILTAAAEIGSLSISLGKLLTVVLILWGTRLVSRFVRFVLQHEVFPRLGLRIGEADAASTLTNYVVLAIGIVAAAAAIGITGTQIAMLIGALGVGIGFGLQNIVNNFISGLILIFERPIQVDDMVEVGGGALLGRVKRIGIRASVVRTFDGSEVVVPNGDLISKEVINWTLSDQVRRRELRVGVTYGTDPERVLEILRKVASSHPEVFEDPEPLVLFLGFGESTLDFSLRYWTTIADNLRVSSEVAVAVNAALREAGIKIPVPQREIRMASDGETEP